MPFVDTLVQLACRHGCADEARCREVLSEAAEQNRPLVTTLLDENLVEEDPFLQGLSATLGLEWVAEPEPAVAAPLRERFPARLVLRHHLLPREEPAAEGEAPRPVRLLTYDPFNLLARQAIGHDIPEPVSWAMAPRRRILEALKQGYGVGAENFDALDDEQIDEALDHLKQETNVLDLEESDEAAVVRFVNQIIREALNSRATDIHVEPLENDLRIRYRIDGQLQEVPVPPQIKMLQASVLSRLKIMSHLDIAERRLPQDGRINLEFEGKSIDVRVACIPSVNGESISLRLLGQETYSFEKLGLDPETEAKVRSLLDLPNGIVLVTGPTGSGKSTSLYTFLSSINTTNRRIVTIEDPVEHKINGVIQIAVKAEINLTFAAGLRSILRGDPNVVMIGEMRDLETAEIAIRAALTGHLVFSTLHTNDAIGGITRLVDMGVEPFLVASAVRAFLAQRLVRVLCPHCKAPGHYPEAYLRDIGFPLALASRIHKAAGCEKCRHTGYLGRTAIYEVVLVTDRLADAITTRKTGNQLRALAVEEGLVSLREFGWRKVAAGVTSVEEVVRVTTADVEIQDE